MRLPSSVSHVDIWNFIIQIFYPHNKDWHVSKDLQPWNITMLESHRMYTLLRPTAWNGINSFASKVIKLCGIVVRKFPSAKPWTLGKMTRNLSRQISPIPLKVNGISVIVSESIVGTFQFPIFVVNSDNHSNQSSGTTVWVSIHLVHCHQVSHWTTALHQQWMWDRMPYWARCQPRENLYFFLYWNHFFQPFSFHHGPLIQVALPWLVVLFIALGLCVVHKLCICCFIYICGILLPLRPNKVRIMLFTFVKFYGTILYRAPSTNGCSVNENKTCVGRSRRHRVIGKHSICIFHDNSNYSLWYHIFLHIVCL